MNDKEDESMEKLTTQQIITGLEELAKQARAAYVSTGSEQARKDNDFITAGLEIIRKAEAQGEDTATEDGVSFRKVRGGTVTQVNVDGSLFDADVRLLLDLKALLGKKEQSVKTAPAATPLLAFAAPGLRGAIPMAMKNAEEEAKLLRRVYDRLSELMSEVRK